MNGNMNNNHQNQIFENGYGVCVCESRVKQLPDLPTNKINSTAKTSSALVVLVLLCLLTACSSASSNPDGDVDIDKLDSTSELDTETNPCNAPDVDCSPGYCEIKNDFVRGTYDRCICPDGYVSSEHKCVTEIDGDIDLELDSDPEKNDVTEHESCGNIAEGPFKDLPCCSGSNNVFPCVADLEFEYTNDKGEFRIGYTDGYSIDIFGLWNKYILYGESDKDHTGLSLVDYSSKQVVRFNSSGARTLNGNIRDNKIVWSESEEIDPIEDTTIWSSLWTSSLDQITRTKLQTSEIAKYQQQVFGDSIYWLAMDKKGSDHQVYLYTLNENGQEEVVGNSQSSIGRFSVYGNNMVWKNAGSQLIKYDLTSKQETFIFDYGWGYSSPKTTADKVYISDLTNSPDPSTHCGYSINAFDLSTLERTTIKANVGFTDYSVSDVWEDWMVYVNCNEGNPAPEIDDQCCTGSGHSDVFLYNLKTKEEWPISASFGYQGDAKMWGPLIVWHDGRHRENGEGHALYGIDLCLHPELKDRFDECKTR